MESLLVQHAVRQKGNADIVKKMIVEKKAAMRDAQADSRERKKEDFPKASKIVINTQLLVFLNLFFDVSRKFFREKIYATNNHSSSELVFFCEYCICAIMTAL